MISGLEHRVISVPVKTGEILEVLENGTRVRVKTRDNALGPGYTEIPLSRGMAALKKPRPGDHIIEMPSGHIDILSPVAFAAKMSAGVMGDV